MRVYYEVWPESIIQLEMICEAANEQFLINHQRTYLEKYGEPEGPGTLRRQQIALQRGTEHEENVETREHHVQGWQEQRYDPLIVELQYHC